jgi:membrane-associated protease RseP (regulator of RpoE activity)
MRALMKSPFNRIIFLGVLLMTSASTAALSAPNEETTLSLQSLVSHAKGSMGTFKFLGITSLHCSNCSFTITPDDGERYWNFNSEPTIKRVAPDGPAAGKLKKGDEIVAIDGTLITTRRAGLRLAAVEPGETVEITVRRGNRTINETIIAKELESESDVVVEGPNNTLTLEIGQRQLAEATEALARYASKWAVSLPDPPGFRGTVKLSQIPALQELTTIVESLSGNYLPAGWFGFRLSLSGTIKRVEDGPAQWRFNDPPKIESIEPDSPAGRAGLEVGDKLVRIDNEKLTSEAGGERFSTVVPGQTVTWTVKRGRQNFDVAIDAIERPECKGVTRRAVEAVPGSDRSVGIHKLRYTGSLGETAVEVTGDDSVEVTVDKQKGLMIIKSRSATVSLRLPDGEH